MYDNIDAFGWTDRQVMDRVGLDLLVRYQRKADALSESGQEQMSLHHGKVHADADAWPRAKWHIGVAGKLSFVLGREAFGIETLRIREVLLAAMQYVRSEQNGLVFGEMVAADLDIA